MLKLSPRTITTIILALFICLFGVRHIAFLADNPDSNIFGRYLISLLKSESRDKRQAIEDIRKKARTFRENTDLVTWLERVDYDIHLLQQKRGTIHPDVTIVEANERSLRELGQFPFTRSVYKTLIQKLQLAGAKVVAFDITFPEEERSALHQMQQIQQQLTLKEGFDSPAVRFFTEKVNTLDVDEALANALSESKLPVVLGFAFSNLVKTAVGKGQEERDQSLRRIFESYDIKAYGGNEEISKDGIRITSLRSESDYVPIVSIDRLVGSLTASSSIGNFSVIPDLDGRIRSVPVMVQYGNAFLGSLGLRAVASYYGEEPWFNIGPEGPIVTGPPDRESKLRVPLMPHGEMLLRFYGEERIFPYTEFSDVISGVFSDEELKRTFGGKIVFVGVTAQGLKDIRGTPFSHDYPGVEAHATFASNVIKGEFLQKDARYYWMGYFFTLICGLLVSLVVYRFHPLFSFVFTVGLGAVLHEATLMSFGAGIVIPSLLPIISSIAVFGSGVIYRYMTEERERRKVRSVFSRYVSSEVVEDILNDPTQLERLTGMKKELTVMFVDLVGFTKLTEHMDVALVTYLLNEYFSRMTAVIFKNQGTLDKFMGDSIMCFWGAPRDTKEHARLACQAALDIQRELAKINSEWRSKHGISLGQRIGVHTGPMAVGNMGTSRRVSYTVLGDNVNLGSRLEGVNTVYGTEIIVSAATAEQAGGSFLFRPLDRVQVKGKEDAVDILELVSEKAEKEPEWVHAFRVGLKHYQAGEWNDAESAFGACLSLKPGDGPAQVFVDRIRDFRIMEPDEWSGVWKLASK